MKLFVFRVPVLWHNHIAWDLIAVSDCTCENKIVAKEYIPLRYHIFGHHPGYCSTLEVVEVKNLEGEFALAYDTYGWAWLKPHDREEDIWNRDIHYDLK